MDGNVVGCEGSGVSEIVESLFMGAGLVHDAREIDQYRNARGCTGQRAFEHSTSLFVVAVTDVKLTQLKQRRWRRQPARVERLEQLPDRIVFGDVLERGSERDDISRRKFLG